MKATDLIHNGIYRVDGKPARFWALNGRFYTYDGMHHICMVYADQKSGEIEGAKLDGQKYIPMKIEPVPITAEILEKNGFTKINSQRYDYGCADTDCYVKVNPKKNMIHVNGRHANSNLYYHSFVHEFQKALYLCGLNDLAENLKIQE